MKLLLGLFHFTIFIFGAAIILNNVKHPNLLMLINKIIIVIYLINYLK
jgi:hypothetical protein